jgi:hypothetical protein
MYLGDLGIMIPVRRKKCGEKNNRKAHRGIKVDHRIKFDQHSKPRNKCK